MSVGAVWIYGCYKASVGARGGLWVLWWSVGAIRHQWVLWGSMSTIEDL